VFPNPGNGNFNLETGNTCQVVIYDVLGKVVFSENFTGGKHQIDLSAQSSGHLFYDVKEDAGETTVKLVKE
jgi:hypothetical protein